MAAPPRTAYGFIGNTFSNWVQFIRTSPLASVFAVLVGDPRSLAGAGIAYQLLAAGVGSVRPGAAIDGVLRIAIGLLSVLKTRLLTFYEGVICCSTPISPSDCFVIAALTRWLIAAVAWNACCFHSRV
jgi:hypothetical protein